MAAILEREPPPLSTVQPLATPALDRLIRTCLAKDPDDRWQTARDLLRELQWVASADTDASDTRNTHPRLRRPRMVAALALAGIAAVAGLSYLAGVRRASSPETRRAGRSAHRLPRARRAPGDLSRRQVGRLHGGRGGNASDLGEADCRRRAAAAHARQDGSSAPALVTRFELDHLLFATSQRRALGDAVGSLCARRRPAPHCRQRRGCRCQPRRLATRLRSIGRRRTRAGDGRSRRCKQSRSSFDSKPAIPTSPLVGRRTIR